MCTDGKVSLETNIFNLLKKLKKKKNDKQETIWSDFH